LFGIVFLVENNFTTKGTPPTQISYTRNHHNSFPINPSFLFPFIILYLWFFLEFFINRNHRAILPLVLTICLGMQIHYSIATYILAPIILAIFFRIKIPIKTIVASLILIVLCISPYLIYKDMTFIPHNDGYSGTFSYSKLDYLENMIRVVGLGHMNYYLHGFGVKALSQTPIPFTLKAYYYGGGLVSFYVLLGIVLIKIRRYGWLENQKALCILALFYFPALIYGLTNPFMGHFWYAYIFIVPQSLVIALCVYSIYEFLSGAQGLVQRIFEKSFVASIMALFLFLTIVLIKHTNQSLKNIEQTPSPVGIGMSHKNMQDILRSVMTSLDLSPDEFYQRVYFFYFNVSSPRILEESADNVVKNIGDSPIESEKPCFFIKGKQPNYRAMPRLKPARLDLFLKDPTIKILSKEDISLSKLGFSNPLEVYTYKPLFSQPCYSNNFNKFIVDKSIWDLLVHAKDVLKGSKIVGVKTISVVSEYNSNQELEKLEGHYVMNHRGSQAPFGFNLSIKKNGGNYLVRGTIQSIYFYKAPDTQPKKVELVFRSVSSLGPIEKPLVVPTGVTVQRETRLIILPENTLVSEGNKNRTSRWSYNQYWYREYEIPSLLIRDIEGVYLSWSQLAHQFAEPIEDLQVKLPLEPK
jgi:hypothetical protein